MERGRWEGRNFQLKEVQRLEEDEEEGEEEEEDHRPCEVRAVVFLLGKSYRSEIIFRQFF